MDIRASNNLIDSLLAQRMGVPSYTVPTRAPAPAQTPPRIQQTERTDIVSLSRDLVASATAQNAGAGQTKLVREALEKIEQGFRRTQTFERPDGRTFTRVEEFTAADRNARRTVIQQNASGNTTRFDEVLERQDDGTFRRTQRFTDEAGETSTQIQTGVISADPFILSGGVTGGFERTRSGSLPLRGTQLDLQA